MFLRTSVSCAAAVGRDTRRPRWLRWGAALLLAALVSGCGVPAGSSNATSAAPRPTAAPLAPAASTVTPTAVTAATAPLAEAATATAAVEDVATDTAALPVAQAPDDRQAVTVTILHTNDTRGEIEPCG